MFSPNLRRGWSRILLAPRWITALLPGGSHTKPPESGEKTATNPMDPSAEAQELPNQVRSGILGMFRLFNLFLS